MTVPVKVSPFAAYPLEYWNDASLRITNGSFDAKHATKAKKVATAPHKYVSDLQADLITLGYLKSGADDGSFGPSLERALKRFQRHAKRSIRFANNAKVDGVPWVGTVTGICDQSTAKEIRSWIAKNQRLPIGMYPIVKITGGRLREDVAALWAAAIADVAKKGGSLLPPTGTAPDKIYSDTARNPTSGFKSTGGNSKLSLHYTGRAIDLSMDPAGGKGQRWWTLREVVDGRTYWRLYCKTDQQDGSQGFEVKAKSVKYYELYKNEGEKFMPAGHYMDLTAALADRGFQRIPAQEGWESIAKKQEWWHFHYTADLQDTFLDEMELIGYTEDVLKKAGWTEAEMDKKPG